MGCADSTKRKPSTSVVSVSVLPESDSDVGPDPDPLNQLKGAQRACCPSAAAPRCRKDLSRGPSRRMTSRKPSH